MTMDDVVALIRAHNTGDEAEFLRVSKAMAEREEAAGRFVAAGRLRAAVEARSRTVRLELAGAPPFVTTTLPVASLDDLVLGPEALGPLRAVLAERARAADLAALGLRPPSRVMLHGPPGNGKTRSASALACAMGVPLHYVSLSGLITSYMGDTGANVAKALRFARQNPGVVFFDEFEAVGWSRAGGDSGGGAITSEMSRVVSAMLQELDAAGGDVFVAAATNMPGSVDRALWRRFDVHVPFARPSREMVARYVAGRARPSLAVEGPDGGHDYAAAAADGGLSVADVERAFDRCARAAVMAGGAAVRAEDLLRAVRAEAEATPGAGGAT